MQGYDPIKLQAGGWLAELCRIVPRTRLGVVLRSWSLGEELIEHARWPEGIPLSGSVTAFAHTAVSEQRPLSKEQQPRASAPMGSVRIAVPFSESGVTTGPEGEEEVGGHGVVVLECLDTKMEDCPALIERIRASIEWLKVIESTERRHQNLADVVELLATTLEHSEYLDAVTALATEMASRLRCERVSIAELRRDRNHVIAISHNASFDPRSQGIRDLTQLMDEACDQDVSVVYPEPEHLAPRVAREHEAYTREHEVETVCTVPMANEGEIVGAVTFEWDIEFGFGRGMLQRCEDAVALIGPLLQRIRDANAGPFTRARRSAASRARKLLGPGHIVAKLTATTVIALASVLALVPGEFRVTADATLEGRVQRAIVASVDGFIAQVEASAGDVVEKGSVLARLDDSDLRLELRRWEGRRAELDKEHREARAAHDRSRMSILGARMAQADAQIELLEASLVRTELTAPFHGVVVQGDLSQSLGSPVEKGAVLFELAPLDGYRVFLQVDERDISQITPGQRGDLKLSAMPRSSLGFTVDRVIPVATASEGRNVFRVEANLEDPSPSLRPGMAGVAKIDIEERSLLWIWTHDLLDRLRLWLWMWRP